MRIKTAKVIGRKTETTYRVAVDTKLYGFQVIDIKYTVPLHKGAEPQISVEADSRTLQRDYRGTIAIQFREGTRGLEEFLTPEAIEAMKKIRNLPKLIRDNIRRH